MGPLFVAFAWMLLAGMVFVPTFIIAIVMLRSVVRAFLLAATFTVGAFAGVITSLLAAGLIVNRAQPPGLSAVLVVAFLTAAAIAGGVLAVFLLGKFSKYPPWRRY